MSRSGVYKMPSLKFTDAKRARAQRADEQQGMRRTARQAQSNAKRGILEVEDQLNKPSQDPVDVEIPHDQKLRERLARLKAFREQKMANEQKAKANKKQPFVVPGVARPEVAKKEVKPPVKTAPAPPPAASRVTRSQTKKGSEPESKQWIVTTNKANTKPAPKKLTKPAETKASKVQPPPEKKPEVVKSFAPSNFIFSAPKEVAEKSLALAEMSMLNKMEPSPSSSVADTPQRSASGPSEDVKISPLLMNNPWITTTRGSSSKKEKQRMSLAASPMSNQSNDVQSSPYLKRRAGSLINTPVNREALHFRSLMASEGSRLNDLCSNWEELMDNGDVPEEERGSVLTVIGQAHLLQRERFNQFAGLVNQFENKTAEKEITPTDLEGFWEMIYLQVSDVDKKFEDLSKLRANGWVKPEEQTKMKKPTRAAAKKKPAATAGAKSNMRAYIMAARQKNQASNANKSPGSPSTRRRSSSLLMRSPFTTPSKRQSLRRSVLINSAKKPTVFVVTELSPKNPPPATALDFDEGEGASRTTDGLPDPGGAAEASPVKTYGRSAHNKLTASPEERLSEAFDALKSDSTKKNKSTRVLRTPVKPTGDEEEVSEATAAGSGLTPRRSIRLKNNNTTNAAIPDAVAGRVSLLPIATISPVIPQDNLMMFD